MNPLENHDHLVYIEVSRHTRICARNLFIIYRYS